MSASTPPDPAEIRALLEDAPYIDDAGFSDRVARALPRRRRASAVPYTVIPAFAGLACALAFGLSGRLASHAVHPAGSLAAMMTFVALLLAVALLASAMLFTADE